MKHPLQPTQPTSRSILAAAAIAFSLFTMTGTALAQRYLGSIAGEVTDSTGAKVPGASVVAEEITTRFKTEGTVNASGAYSFPSLNPGTYTVTLTLPGFKTEIRENVILTAGQLQEVDFKLTMGAVTETVEVKADNALLDTGSANIATTLTTQEVTDTPNIGRNPFVMATLAAGVINSGSGGYFQGKASQYTNPFSGVAVQITTQGTYGHNRITLNGIPDDTPERFSGPSYTGYVPSPEAVEEVKVQTSIFDAQVGHGGGTVTNTVVRNGTNRVHGAAYYVFQNTYLNANTFERVPTQNTTTPRNNDQLSQTGAVFDGPVLIPKVYDGRDKTFFMISFERYASHTAQNYSARVPTAAELTGDFSALCSSFNGSGFCTSGIQLYQPNSPVDANGNRTQYFANNNISGSLNQAGSALATYLPSANIATSSISGTNYIAARNDYGSTYPSLVTRIDQAIGTKNKFNAIYFQAGLTQTFPLMGFPKEVGPSGYGYHVYRNTRGGSLDDVHQFSNSLVLDSRFGLIYHPFGLIYPDSENFDLSSIDVTNDNVPYSSFPGTLLGDGYASLAAGAGGQVSESTNGSLEEIVTKTIKTHTLRIGFEGNLLRYNVQNPESGFGAFTFDRRFTQENSVSKSAGADPYSGDSFADSLLGYASSLSYSVNASYALQQIYMAPFLQDDWRVTEKLTLNLGLRYDYESPFTERYNKQNVGFCTTCVNPLQASVSGLTLNGGLEFATASNRFPYKRDLNNMQPRLGAAYQWNPTTVVRAGFGIIYFNTLESPFGTGYSSSTSYNNYSSSAPIYSISDPFPTGIVEPTGSSLGLSTGLGQAVYFVDPNHVQPKSAQYTVNVQQQFPGNLSLQISYVGAKPTHLEVNHNIDILPAKYINQGPAEVGILNAQVANPMAGKISQSTTLNAATISQYLLYYPYPEFSSVYEYYSSIGSAPYNALQIQVSKPMKNHLSLQGNFTWDKVMNHTAYLDTYAADIGKLESVQDSSPTLFGNIFGTFELPKFMKLPFYERLAVGGWQLNGVVRMTNGPLIAAPSTVDIVGNYRQAHQTLTREFNTCSQTVSIVNNTAVYTTVNTTSGVSVGCDSQSPRIAFRQRYSYTSQNNSSYLNVREPLKPLVDLSLFKKFILREGTSFEIRGEFFNILNTPNFGGPSTTLGGSSFGSAASSSGQLIQANDPRIGQLTARINF